MTPSLPTLSIASAIIFADALVAVRAHGTDLCDLLRVGDGADRSWSAVTMASTALSMPRLSSIGL